MPAIADMGDVFVAPTAQAIRNYMRQSFQGALEQYDRVVLPLAGRFQIAEMAVNAGWRTGEIQCADINLFSSIVGYMAMGRDLAALNIEFHGDVPMAAWAREQAAAGQIAGATFLLMKLTQLDIKRTLDRLVRTNIWNNRDAYAAQFEASAMRLAAKLSGLDYKVADLGDVITEAGQDERAVIYVEPNRVSYDAFRCVAEQGNDDSLITWNGPRIAPFDPKSGMDAVYHAIMPANALTFVHDRSLPETYADRATFVIDRGAEQREYILSNRPDEARTLAKSRLKTAMKPMTAVSIPINYVGEDCMAGVWPVPKETALYYADLWGQMPKGRVGQGYVILLDGMIAGACGINYAAIRQSKGPWINLLWYALPPNQAWPGLVDAVFATLLCEDSRTMFDAHANAPLYDVTSFRIESLDTEQFVPFVSSDMPFQVLQTVEKGRAKVTTWMASFSKDTWTDCIANALEKTSESPDK